MNIRKFNLFLSAISLLFPTLCMSMSDELEAAALSYKGSCIAEIQALTQFQSRGIFSKYSAFVAPLSNKYIRARILWKEEDVETKVQNLKNAIGARSCFVVSLQKKADNPYVWRGIVHQGNLHLHASFVNPKAIGNQVTYGEHEKVLCTRLNEQIDFTKPFQLHLHPLYKKNMAPLKFSWNEYILREWL